MATCQRFDFNDKNAREMIAHIEAFSMEKFLGIMAGTVIRSVKDTNRKIRNIEPMYICGIWISSKLGSSRVNTGISKDVRL